MPTPSGSDTALISAEALREFGAQILMGAGTPGPAAARVAAALVESNLVGHDSHGVLRLPQYVKAIQAGTLNPAGELKVVRESLATALIDCGRTFGQVAAERGMALALEKAAQCGTGTVVLQHCDHIGRLGEYVVTAARQGYIGQVICNGSDPGGIVAPYGGSGRALGANPIAWSIPTGSEQPIFFDFATSVVAQGKLVVAADRGEDVPEGWLLDKHGQPTRKPQDQFDGGVILPFGGHKGYALSMMIEAIGGGLSGVGFAITPGYRWNQGTVLTAIDVNAFQPRAEFEKEVVELARRLKETPLAAGFDEILMPGDVEWRSRAQRARDGIPMAQNTWDRLTQLAATLGVAPGRLL
ncbi:MAG: Ldh family oxidoreductase [Anaerolineales bacterium]